MKYADGKRKLEAARKKIAKLRDDMRKVTREIEPEEIDDYELETGDGPVKLSDLFGEKDDLIVIHNMGASCPLCTMWADGFNGIIDHLQARAAFVVVTPDPPAAQKRFAATRGWRFPMASHRGRAFARDMGYWAEPRGWVPGVSAFHKQDGRIVRLSDTELSPHDDFNPIWHFFDLFPNGHADWWPKFKY